MLLVSLFLAALYFATPLILAALGELVVERAGVVNIGIEGMMLAGALGAWAVDGWIGPIWGLAAAVLAAWVLAVVFAIACLTFSADQIVAGTGINLLALGVTGMVRKLVPESLQDHVVAMAAEPMWELTLLIGFGVWIFLRFTRPGLELIAIGEAPEAADAAGVRVNWRKFWAILFGAACAGLGGAWLSIVYVRVFTDNMTDGVGFLALAIVIFGRWNVGGIFIGGLFFGLVRALALAMQTHSGFPAAMGPVFEMLPYLVSLAALAGVAGRSSAPTALRLVFKLLPVPHLVKLWAWAWVSRWSSAPAALGRAWARDR